MECSQAYSAAGTRQRFRMQLNRLKGKGMRAGKRSKDYPLDNSRDNEYYDPASQGGWP
jgi:hypothetical protein